MASGTDWKAIHAALSAPFPDTEIKERPGKGGMSFSYIDARAVEDRLDGTVGAENWTDTYEVFSAEEKAVLCRLTVHGVTKTGVGYPNSERDEEPYKAAESDALKRAAVKFGIGRFLYGLAPSRNGHGAPQQKSSMTDLRGTGTGAMASTAQKAELQTIFGKLAEIRGTGEVIGVVLRAGCQQLGIAAAKPSDLTATNAQALIDWGRSQIDLITNNAAPPAPEPAEMSF